MVQTRTLVATLIAASLTACGGGGGGSTGDTTTGTTVSGVVSAPAALAAKLHNPSFAEMLAAFVIPSAHADLIGTQAVASATVELVEVNEDGSDKTVASTTTTDATGHYQFSDVTLGSNYLLRVHRGAEVMRAPLAATTMDIDPVTETITGKVLAAGISNFSIDKLAALIESYKATDLDVGVAASVAQAVSMVNTAAPSLDAAVQDMSAATTPTPLATNYNVVGIVTALKAQNGLSVLSSSDDIGTATADASGNISFALSSRELISGQAEATDSSSASGKYTIGQTGTMIVYNIPPRTTAAVSTDRDVFSFTLKKTNANDWSTRGLLIAAKQASAAPDIDGTTFNMINFSSSLSSTSADSSTATFSAGQVNGNPYSIDNKGVLTLNGKKAGFVTQDGQLLVARRTGAGTEYSLNVALAQGSGMSATSLSGSYNFVGLSADNASDVGGTTGYDWWPDRSTKKMVGTFNSGTFTTAAADYDNVQANNDSGTYTIFARTEAPANPTRTYTVSPTGVFDASQAGFPVRGAVSADGKYVVFYSEDTANAVETLWFGIKAN